MPLARQLRQGFNGLWAIAEIVLFVLLGASIQVGVFRRDFLARTVVVDWDTGRAIAWLVSIDAGQQLDRPRTAVSTTREFGQGNRAGGDRGNSFGNGDRQG